MADLGLPSVGAHCALSSCNLNDFLPIRCQCLQFFCSDHISPDLHDCPLRRSAQLPLDSPAFQLQRCAAHGCNKPSLESFIANSSDTANRSPALCTGCNQAFCAHHREPSSHACTPLPQSTSSQPVPEKNAAAKALLAKHFGTAASATNVTPSATQKVNPKKEAQQRKIAAMKMRHKAQPGDPRDASASVPIDQRLHVTVTQDGLPGSERVFWFRKTLVAGRALDMLATHFKLTISDTQPLNLVSLDGGAAGDLLRNDQPLGDQVSDGSSVALRR